MSRTGSRGDARVERINAGRHVERCIGAKEARVAREELVSTFHDLAGYFDQLAAEPARGVVGEIASAVRRADGNDAADGRIGVKEKRVGKSCQNFGIRIDFGKRLFA